MSKVLSALERDILRAFFSLDRSEAFVLTGGAALAEYYFQHRRSNDLDLFTLDDEAFARVVAQTNRLAEMVGAREVSVRSLATLHQVQLVRDQDDIKLDFVRDSGPVFGEPVQSGLVRIDALENIGANKVDALFGRAAVRDYIDLYLILNETSLTFDELLEKAKAKDVGLQEFYLANWIRQQTPRLTTLPDMLIPIDLEKVKAFFLRLADDLMADLNPDKPASE